MSTVTQSLNLSLIYLSKIKIKFKKYEIIKTKIRDSLASEWMNGWMNALEVTVGVGGGA